MTDEAPGTKKAEDKLGSQTLLAFLGQSWFNWLLIFVPIGVIIEVIGLPKLWLFIASALAIIPLAGLIGEATEQVANRVGVGIGGFLNASFGNATELIIGVLALRAGLQEVVKASISGSIISNILLIFGLSMLVGGWHRKKQVFNRTRAGASAGMLFLAVVALVMPALFQADALAAIAQKAPVIEYLSVAVAFVLIMTYAAGLVFGLRTHRELLTSVPTEIEEVGLNLQRAVILMLVATAATGVMAELLVQAISVATKSLGLTEFFVGVVVVALVGNAAEHYSAVSMATKNKMDLSIGIATGSATQIALFVAPVLVFASLFTGQPMSLVFNSFEVVGIGLSVIALTVVALDGESNWFEGVQLIAVYLVLAIVFYFVPGG